MLTAVKNQMRISLLSIKYALQREMLNKVTFFSNIFFMILNNASFIVQWIILFSLKSNIGGYGLKEVILLWGFASGTFGVAHFFFKDAFELSETINSGKLDTFLIQPKNVLISCISSSVEVSALGDIIYAIIMFCIYGFSFKKFLVYILCCIMGGLIMASVAVITSSLGFYFGRAELLSNTWNHLLVNFATYPDGIFKTGVKILFYTIIPIGFTVFLPVKIIRNFNGLHLLFVVATTLLFIGLSFLIFYKGLKKYSSSNLMNVRM